MAATAASPSSVARLSRGGVSYKLIPCS
jgi:hypothetical protein